MKLAQYLAENNYPIKLFSVVVIIVSVGKSTW